MIEDELRNAMASRSGGIQPNRERLYKAQLEASRRRRHRDTATAALASSAFSVLAVLGIVGAQGQDLPVSPSNDETATVNLAAQIEAATPVPASPTTAQRPSVIAAAAASGRLVLIDSQSGKTTQLLTTVPNEETPGRGSLLGGVAYSPHNRQVYFDAAAPGRCDGEIRAIPVGGGKVTVVASGGSPAISADGKSLALVRNHTCKSPQLIIRNLQN